MSFRFFRRVKLAPGISLNLSKSGPSVSFGPRGAKLTVGPRGTRTTFGIPGTGLYYTSSQSNGSRSRSNQSAGLQPDLQQQASSAPHLNLGFFEKLVTPPEEQQFVDGLREMMASKKDAALTHLAGVSNLADGAFMAGWLCLEKQDFANSERYLGIAIMHESEIGKLFQKYGISPHISLAVTDELVVHMSATPTAARLAVVEILQRQQRWNEAFNILSKLYQTHPDDMLIRLSIVELMMHGKPNDQDVANRVIKLAEGITNESPVHAATLLYKSRALRILKMPTAAIQELSGTLRKKKDYPDDLLYALRYERALAYDDAGQKGRYRAELEKLYADAPAYEDVAQRLGL